MGSSGKLAGYRDFGAEETVTESERIFLSARGRASK